MNTLERVLTFAAVVAICIFIAGCSFASLTNYVYDNGDQYTAGDRDISDAVTTIDIDYLSGDVTVVEADTDHISIRETSKKQLDDQRKVHSWVDGSTLYIRYCASAKRLDLYDLDKKLTIEIPRDMELANFRADISSGNVDAACTAKDIKVEASSGNIRMEQHGNSETIRLEASSGNVELIAENADKADLKASSGNITARADSIISFKSESSSGSGDFTFLKLPELSNIEASSGDITIYIPKDADLSAQISTSSGDLYSEIEFSKNDENYICGNGTNRMKIETSSGNVYVKTLSE